MDIVETAVEPLTQEDAVLTQDASTLRALLLEAKAKVLAFQQGEEPNMTQTEYMSHLRQSVNIMHQLNQSTAGPKKKTSDGPSARGRKAVAVKPQVILDLSDL